MPADARALQHTLRRLARLPEPPWLHQEVGRRMAERLAFIKLQPETVLDWGAFLGASAEPLRAAYPRATRVALEPTPELLARSQPAAPRWWSLRKGPPQQAQLCADVAPASGQLLWSNMQLHLQPDTGALLAQWQRALAVDGFVMFSTFGPDTLRELRELYQAAGWPAPHWPFTDMHDLGDALVHAGFADPVMDQEPLTLTWSSPQALLAELRQLGANTHPERLAGLRTPRWHARLLQALQQRADAQGRIAMSFEVVYGHAFRPVPRLQVGPVTAVPLEDLRMSLIKRKR